MKWQKRSSSSTQSKESPKNSLDRIGWHSRKTHCYLLLLFFFLRTIGRCIAQTYISFCNSALFSDVTKFICILEWPSGKGGRHSLVQYVICRLVLALFTAGQFTVPDGNFCSFAGIWSRSTQTRIRVLRRLRASNTERPSVAAGRLEGVAMWKRTRSGQYQDSSDVLRTFLRKRGSQKQSESFWLEPWLFQSKVYTGQNTSLVFL